MAELVLGLAGGGTGASAPSSARFNLGIKDQSAAVSLGGVAGLTGFSSSFRIPLLSGSGGADGYQLKLVVGESSGSTGVDFHVGGESEDFPSGENAGGDFNFVKANGDVVPFYVESVLGTTPDRVAVIWVACPNGTAADIIFLLTNNDTGIASQSDPELVFPSFFDSFGGTSLDTAKWTAMNSTGVTVGSGSMRHTNNSARVRSNATFSANIVLEMLWLGVTRNTNGHMVGGFGNSAAITANAIGYLWHPGNDFIRNDGSWFGQSVVLATNTEIVLRMIATSSAGSNFVNVIQENYLTGAQLYNSTFSNVVANENIVIGQRFDNSFGGQAVDMSWRWVRIRQQGTAPTLGTVQEI